MSAPNSNPSAARGGAPARTDDDAVARLESELGARQVAEYPVLPGTLTPTSYKLPEGLDFEAWERGVGALLSMARSISFWLGDALVYGEDHFAEGDQYAAAIEMSGLELSTLRNAVSVCRSVARSRRRESLSYSHHAAVASLDPTPQERMLDKAEARGWTHKQLRGAVRRMKAGQDVEDEARRCECCGRPLPSRELER
jgi:hypothetical protein